MAEFNCKISLREDMGLYLTVAEVGLPLPWTVLFVGPIDDPNGTDWTVKDIPETGSRVIFKRNGKGHGMAVTWVYGPDNSLILSTYKAGWPEQVGKFDELDGGYVAINNHDKTRVMDRSGNPRKREYVISHPWNGGLNQQWFLHEQ